MAKLRSIQPCDVHLPSVSLRSHLTNPAKDALGYLSQHTAQSHDGEHVRSFGTRKVKCEALAVTVALAVEDVKNHMSNAIVAQRSSPIPHSSISTPLMWSMWGCKRRVTSMCQLHIWVRWPFSTNSTPNLEVIASLLPGVPAQLHTKQSHTPTQSPQATEQIRSTLSTQNALSFHHKAPQVKGN